MNAITAIEPQSVVLAIPDDASFETWLGIGRGLANQKRNIDWLIGDWINFGKVRYPEQIELVLIDLGEDPRRLKRIEATVKAFPPHCRDAALSFDHHAHLADLPTQEALPLLKRAHDQNLSAKQVRIEAIMKKLDLGLNLPRDDDPDHDHLLALTRAWNRAPVSVREEFAEMVSESHLGVIDA